MPACSYASFLTPPLMTTSLLRRHVPHHAYAACLSIATAFFATGQIIGPVIGGVVVERYGLQFSVAYQCNLYGDCRSIGRFVWTTATKV
ncbi:hypothetical protein [Paenibacillus sp. Marseille-P2973]|uniref:hypothetical protein n=1 Tax=Paenibacillus sp. Marseille-P2973 TaxID=1871032 RepID=UPI001FFD9E39|nr:hypothetical protein [Paenibacillus sp. Marseille-P2973]